MPHKVVLRFSHTAAHPKSQILQTPWVNFNNYVWHDNIFGFDISVSDFKIMHVFYPMKNIIHRLTCSAFIKVFFFLFFQLIEQGPFLHKLQNQVNVLMIVKVSIKLQKIWMIQKKLHFHLHSKLVLKFMSFDNGLFHLFEGNEKTRNFMNCHWYRPKSTFSQMFDYGKVLKLRRSNRVLFDLFEGNKFHRNLNRIGWTSIFCGRLIKFFIFISLWRRIKKKLIFLNKCTGRFRGFRLFELFRAFEFLHFRWNMNQLCRTPQFVIVLCCWILILRTFSDFLQGFEFCFLHRWGCLRFVMIILSWCIALKFIVGCAIEKIVSKLTRAKLKILVTLAKMIGKRCALICSVSEILWEACLCSARPRDRIIILWQTHIDRLSKFMFQSYWLVRVIFSF